MLPSIHPVNHCLYLSGIFSGSQQEIFGMVFALYRQKIFKKMVEIFTHDSKTRQINDLQNQLGNFWNNRESVKV